MPALSVDHVITDPPYEATCHDGFWRQKRERVRSGDSKVRQTDKLPFAAITESERILSGAHIGRVTSRWALVFCQIEAAMLWRAAMDPPMRYVGTTVWDKIDAAPCFAGHRPSCGIECISTMHSTARMRWNGGGRRGVWSHSIKDGERLHPTQKPIELMLELVRLFSDPDEIILDPYCGSGSTGAACLRAGRRFIGIEKDAAWARTATERLEAESRDQGLAEYRSGQTTMFDRSKA
jgi:site-specific DNA-methyltransferase (adenine-specific)